MDFQNAPTPPSPPARRRAAAGAALLFLALYAVLLIAHVGAVAGGSDSSGYMNHARLLASERVHVPPRIIPGLPQADAPPFLYVPLGFKPAWNGDGLVPTYPAGFALFVLALKPLAGWRHAGDLAIILHSLAGLVATYALGRMLGLGRNWAAFGAAIVALSPLYLWSSLQAMSDVPSLVWTTAAVLAALKSRERAAWAVAAGGAIAVDVLLRPTNVLAFAPVAVALGASPRRWMLFIAGGVPGAIFFCAHSAAAYGSYLATGYGDNTSAFRAGLVPATLLHYARWLPVLFTPAAALVLGLPWLGGETVRSRWLLGTWVAVFAGFYSAYECTHETWWYLRFLLPAVPAIVVGGLLVLRALLSRAPALADPGRSVAALAAALALVAGISFWATRDLHALSIGKAELRYGRVADWMTSNVPPGAVCLTMQASGALFYYTQLTFVRWDVLDKANIGKVESAIRNSRRPLYAVLFPFEIEQLGALERLMPGHWSQVGKVQDVTIWRRDLEASKL
ncbi:MAG TPA: hypothetical protein VN775_06730 [Opitutaceae bacterium]|nr:hypothetical protein [Opitutaceae bacterium]